MDIAFATDGFLMGTAILKEFNVIDQNYQYYFQLYSDCIKKYGLN